MRGLRLPKTSPLLAHAGGLRLGGHPQHPLRLGTCRVLRLGRRHDSQVGPHSRLRGESPICQICSLAWPDGNNDYFIPINLDDYPSPYLVVYNRWGKIVYEKESYQYDWEGTHYKTGKELKEGVYFYVVSPNSSKYEYLDHKKEDVKRTISGYVHLVR